MSKSKSKKITYNMIASQMQPIDTIAVRVGDFTDIELQVTPYLSFDQSAAFMSSVISNVVDMDELEYSPEYFEFILRVVALNVYAGIPIPKDFGKAYDVVYKTSIYENVLGVIDIDQYEDIVEAVKEKIKYMRDVLVSTAGSKMKEIVSGVNGILDESKKVLDNSLSADLDVLRSFVESMPENKVTEVALNESGVGDIITMPRKPNV